MNRDASVFLNDYQTKLEQELSLPAAITDSYNLMDCLQQSTFKTTCLITSKADGTTYVLKTASHLCKENLAEEYSLLCSLDIPAIPRAVTYFEDSTHKYLIRSYIKGRTLQQRVEKDGPFREEDAAAVLSSLCDTVLLLHAQNPPIIHRDIKPQNVVLTHDQTCALIDFGTARRFQSSLRKDTVYLGTQDTAAPEQFGYKQTDIRSDIYSMGVLLLYLCTGGYDLDNVSLLKHSALAGIIKRCTRFDPDRRYANVRQLQGDLRRIFRAAPAAKPLLIGIVLGFAAGFAVAALLPLGLTQPSPSVPTGVSAAIQQVPVAGLNEPVVTFDSPVIEQAVRAQLGVDATTPLRQIDLDQVTTLFLFGEKQLSYWEDVTHHARYLAGTPSGEITSLSDIPKLRNLRELCISNQAITDLSPLKNMQIVRLALGGNRIFDLSPLAQMPYLQELFLENNPFLNLQPLADCAFLHELCLNGTSVVDFSPLYGSEIKTLYLNSSNVDDYSFLAELPKLTRLSVSNLQPDDLELVYGLKNLTMLEYHGDLLDLNPLLRLTRLTDLLLLDTRISSLEGISSLDQLQYLCLSSSEVVDLAPLTDLPALRTLDIYNLAIRDDSVLFQLKHLSVLYCSPEKKAALEAGDKPIPFEVVPLS